MFTNSDFRDYFSEINRLEQDMLKIQTLTISKLRSPELTAAIDQVIKDEIRHIKLTNELLAMLEPDKAG